MGLQAPKGLSTEPGQPTQPDGKAEADNKYKCGTLQYTKAGLFVLFAWLLWGDFCYMIFERLGGAGGLGLLLMDDYKVTNVQLNILFSVIPMLMGSILTPIISFKSDRHRSRMGRRIPFILYTTPFLCLFAAALGFVNEILAFFKNNLNEDSFITPVTAGLLTIGFLIVGFTFFNEFIGTVFYYLFADVVPPHFMGRFQALFRLVGAMAGFLISKYITGMMISHIKWIHVGAAILYFFGLGLMCLKVKEGEYPPVTDVTEKTTFGEKIRLYFKEGFSHRIYTVLYISSAMAGLISVIHPQGVFNLHLGQHQNGVVAHTPSTSNMLKTNPDGTFASPKVMAMTPNGRILVSSGDDGLVKLWEKAGKELKLLKTFSRDSEKPGGDSSILCVAITPDGKAVLSGSSDGFIDVWDTTTGSHSPGVKAHEGEIRCIALSPAGTLLASASTDTSIKVWDISNWKCINTLKGHEGSVNCVAFSSKADRLVSGSSDKKILIWDVQNGMVLKTLEGSPGSVFSVCFAPALEMSIAKNSQVITSFINGVPNYFKDVFSNDSLHEYSTDNCGIPTGDDLWVLSGGRESDDIEKKRNPNELNSDLRIWDVAENKLLKKLKGHKKAICSIVYKSDLRMILSGSLDGSVRLWDPVNISELAGDQSFKSISGYTTAVTCITCEADGMTMLNASANGMLHVWDIDQGVSLRKGGIAGSFFAILGILLAYPFGALVDRHNPVRIVGLMTFLVAPFPFLSYFFIHDHMSGVWLQLIRVVFGGVVGAATIPLLITVLPKSKFGQLCSANALVRQLIQGFGGFFVALFLDWVTAKSLDTDNFRYSFLLAGLFSVIYSLSTYKVYCHWKKLGGDNYVAPEVA